MKKLCQVVSWLLLVAIAVLSLIPPSFRPVTYIPQDFEHIAIFLITGVAFAIGYPHRRLLQVISLTAFAGAIEIAQLWVPGRHMRISDIIDNVLGACIGIGLVLIFMMMKNDKMRR